MTTFNHLLSFNEAGIERFRQCMHGDLAETQISASDPDLTSPVAGSSSFTVEEFATSYEMAEAILHSLNEAPFLAAQRDTGLWCWLTFVLRDQLFKRSSDNKLRTQERNKWFPSAPMDYRKAQRHKVRMRVVALETLGDSARHLLCGHPSVHGDVIEQCTSQQDMFNRNFQEVAALLYYDDETGKLKRGSGAKGPGSPRRLAAVYKQLRVTWEISVLTAEEFLNLLPPEFNRFRPI
ncbi:MAG: hypothetical protein Alpg2KO_08000 [Alphaproteobacteria bacterium]